MTLCRRYYCPALFRIPRPTTGIAHNFQMPGNNPVCTHNMLCHLRYMPHASYLEYPQLQRRQKTVFFSFFTPIKLLYMTGLVCRILPDNTESDFRRWPRMIRTWFRYNQYCLMNVWHCDNMYCHWPTIPWDRYIHVQTCRLDNNYSYSPNSDGILLNWYRHHSPSQRSSQLPQQPLQIQINVSYKPPVFFDETKNHQKMVVRRLITIFRNCVAYLIFRNPPDRYQELIFVVIIKRRNFGAIGMYSDA